MPTIARRFLILTTTALLAACGGGGGGSDFSSSTPARQVPITAANAAAVASITLGTLDGVAVLSDFALNLAFDLLAPLDGYANAAAAGRSAPGPRLVETMDCLVAGDVTIDSRIATAGTLEMDDRIEIDFDGCNDGDGIIIDGSLALKVEADLTGDLGTGFFLLQTDATLDRLLITADGTSLELDGTTELDIDTREDDMLHVAVQATTLDVEIDAEPATLGDFLLTVDTDITDPDDWEYTTAAAGTLTAEALGDASADGEVSFETIDPLVERDSAPYPLLGQFEIRGDDDSSVLVSDAPGDEVLLDVDADGNGTVEVTLTTTWSALVP